MEGKSSFIGRAFMMLIFEDLKEGDLVDFNLRRDPRGSSLRAVNVRRV